MYQWLFLREFASVSVATSVTSAILCKKKYRVGEEIDFVFFCSCIQEPVKMICAEMKSIYREKNTRRILFFAGYMELTAIPFCGMVRSLMP